MSTGYEGYSFPLPGGGDLHRNSVGGDHWTIRLPGGYAEHFTPVQFDRFIDAWRTNQLPINFVGVD